ncbi:uncharacterized protein LOC117293828 isoform X1 [Asterias rubens]|uniref:uncharacterized protein LOC117293828 isoform X1 n=1 Tax=Asterias rubens TaxID=7604 RepID=UPI00145589E5|nr:uncharacterized protein LOC117293828 isoform X1 [Asterias rubens]XP_033632174.1 uncharacterized protein LOC117293828 isoform X1 [Asterias rubens]
MTRLALVWIVTAVYSFAVVGAQKTNDLMCYNCSHSYAQGVDVGEMNCKDPFANNGIKKIKCNGLCVKHTIEGDVPTISRNCHTLQEGDCVELDRFKLSYGGFLSQHCCRNNLCNSAGAMTFNLFILGAVVLVGLFVCIDLS